MAYEEPEKSQFSWEKTINRCHPWDNKDVGNIWQSGNYTNALTSNCEHSWNKWGNKKAQLKTDIKNKMKILKLKKSNEKLHG